MLTSLFWRASHTSSFRAAICALCCAPAAHAATPPPASDDSNACIAPYTFIRLGAHGAGTAAKGQDTPPALGSYERISPDGRFVLRSFSGAMLGQVSLVELPAYAGETVAVYRTPLANEAFPVQGTWRYLVNINGAHYRFADILRQQTQAKPLFKGGMTGFYAAAAELPETQRTDSGQPQVAASQPVAHNNTIRIRSLSWPNQFGNGDNMGEGALTTRTISVDVQQQRVVADSGVQYLCGERVREDGNMYALPMISVDGQEFATMPQMPVQGNATMRIFGFGAQGNGCTLHDSFPHPSGKTIFGFPHPPGGSGDLAYEYRAQIWWYNRHTRQYFNLAPMPSRAGELLLASAFPGITRDGRIIYASTLRQCNAHGKACTETPGYSMADPWQSPAFVAWRQQHPTQAQGLPTCITRADVQRERAAFARFHGLAQE